MDEIRPVDNFPVNELALYLGDNQKVNDKITIYQPTIGDICEFGEDRYFAMVSTLCAIPSDMKVQLFDMGIDYDSLSDFELFSSILSRILSQEETRLLLGDIDLSKMDVAVNDENGNVILVDNSKGIVIDEFLYLHIVKIIRKMHNIVPKIEHAYDNRTKKLLIESDRQMQAINARKPKKSTLLPLISTMVNMPGFKYKTNELKEIGIVEFLDSVKRVPMLQTTNALLHGCYGGMIDASKINKEELNFFRDVD